jgi:glycerol kinase
MSTFLAALDQGTTSSRCILFAPDGAPAADAQEEHGQHYPAPGLVEHDATEIFDRVQSVLKRALADAGAGPGDVTAIGITNQRETTVVWDRASGRPLAPAIVWQDMRTDAICRQLVEDGHEERVRRKTGLPIATYFSGPKIRWLLENVPDLRAKVAGGDALFGTVDSWLLWKMTGVHATDVTNASRTMLMDLATGGWDPELLELLEVPAGCLPEIRSCSEVYGHTADGIAVAGMLGDQQAALVGQACCTPGSSKNTYGTGCFLLIHTGEEPRKSKVGLVTTVAYQMGQAPRSYAIEGSVAIAGALVQWLRDNLGLIGAAPEIEALAASVEDNGGVYFVPAFSGLFAPYWQSDARGVICGLTRYANKGHIARAALEAVCYQTRDVLVAAETDLEQRVHELRVDGGMVRNDLLMQLQADVLGIPVVRSAIAETTSLGAAFAAGLATGVFGGTGELARLVRSDRTFEPAWSEDQREAGYARWKKAIERSLEWV